MIRFEDDPRTRGEQLYLRGRLLGTPLGRRAWEGLQPHDFAHDLHGRIFRHASRLLRAGTACDRDAVFRAMRDEPRARGARANVQGVAEYLALLTGDAVLTGNRSAAIVAFVDAVCEQHEARAAAQRGRA